MPVKKLEISRLPLADAFIIRPFESSDERGTFYKLYTEELLKGNGVAPYFQEQYISVSRKGVVRGLHYQAGAFAQGKLVQCVKGDVYDVILDLRRDSPTFGRWAGVSLSDKGMHSLFVPRGFAHGFASLTEGASLQYHVDNIYSPQHERGVRWNDPALAIDWKVKNPFVSERDKSFPLFKDAEYF